MVMLLELIAVFLINSMSQKLRFILDGQILIFEFEVPVDGLVLPEKNAIIRVGFDDSGDSCDARVLGPESSKAGF